jgi:hypothetical protein
MRRIGIISNPHSERNKALRWPRLDPAFKRAGVLQVELERFSELPQIVADFSAAGVELIVVDGGDGTVQALLTALLNDAALPVVPQITVVPSGMTNLIAADVGLKGHRSSLRHFLDGYAKNAPLRVARRPTIRLEILPRSTACSGQVTYGMFFGTAAVYNTAQFALQHIHPAGIKHTAGVVTALAVATSRLLCRDDAWRDGECIDVAVDGVELEPRRRFLLLATTLHRLVLGMRPFWDDRSGPLRFLDIAAPPHRFSRALLPTLLGRPRKWMAANGYRSGRADQLKMVLNSPFMLDGQVFHPESAQTVILSAGPTIEFARI